MEAQNTNYHYDIVQTGFIEDQTCNGGFQSYCCRCFRTPTDNVADDLNLISSGDSVVTAKDLEKRDVGARSEEVGA